MLTSNRCMARWSNALAFQGSGLKSPITFQHIRSHVCENEYGKEVRDIVFLTALVITIFSILSSWTLVRMGRMNNMYQILWIWNTNSITKLHATAATTWRQRVSRNAKGTTGLQRTLMSRWETRITRQEYSSYKNQIMNYRYYYYYYYYYYCYYYAIIINTTLRKTEVSALQYTLELTCISLFHKTIFYL